MLPTLALVCCAIGVMALLLVERRHSRPISVAVWLPTAWLLIAASRPLTTWFGSSALPTEDTEAGSALDRLVLSALIGTAVLLSIKRRVDWKAVTRNNAWLLILFVYMAVSISWSDFPMVSFKRWVRTLGPLLMGIIILTDREPLKAFEAAFRRTAYILIPFSLLLVKYYQAWGVEYNRWSGQIMWTGVTSNKNSLGQLCAVSLLLLAWMALKARRWHQPRGNALLISDLSVASIGLFLLGGSSGAYSATSIALLAIGGATLLTLYYFRGISRFAVTHFRTLLIAGVIVFWSLNEFVIGSVSTVLGRDETLTGRTDIWRSILDVAAQSPLIGVGYGGFWGLRPEITSGWGVTQSHNGYLNIYLELGLVGLLGFAVFVLALCNRIRRAFTASLDVAVLALCCTVLTLLYNISESALLTTGFLWTTMVMVTVLTTAPMSAARAVDAPSVVAQRVPRAFGPRKLADPKRARPVGQSRRPVGWPRTPSSRLAGSARFQG